MLRIVTPMQHQKIRYDQRYLATPENRHTLATPTQHQRPLHDLQQDRNPQSANQACTQAVP